ncbi:hypothetical protein BDL97_13G095600 [Sphagnum fallax]|nr:hypothetical protein BDL97_13G095600 [Sphagnum fallax]
MALIRCPSSRMRATESPVYGNGVVCENVDAVSGRSIRVAKLGRGARVVDNGVAGGLRVSTVLTLKNNSWPASTSLLEQVTGRASQHWQTSGVLRINERAAASAKVQEEKSVEGLQTVDVEELPVLSTKEVVSLQIPEPLSMVDLALPPRHGSDLRVAYQGVPGAYSEAAAAKAYPSCEAVPCDQFEAAFQALAQCEQTLSTLGVSREAVDDTAIAAQLISAHSLRDTAAVASARAAELYGLEILMDGIQDDLDNVTRFLILARDPIIPRIDRPFKTSIVFTLEEGPGVLFKALAVFSLRSISLTKIESRPQRKRPLRVVDDRNLGTAKYFDYLFYVDFEASMADQQAQNALGHLQEFATFLRVLGSYPMDVNPMRA